jgi:hypothetical protein
VLYFELFSKDGSYSLGLLHETSVTQVIDSSRAPGAVHNCQRGFLRIQLHFNEKNLYDGITLAHLLD